MTPEVGAQHVTEEDIDNVVENVDCLELNNHVHVISVFQ